MSWSPLKLNGLSFLGKEKTSAVVNFEYGLNVVCGASDTGKSFIVESIDYVLGSRDKPRPIPESLGYTNARLSIHSNKLSSSFTLERDIQNGRIRKFDGNILVSEPSGETISLSPKHSHGKTSSLSPFLLELLGLNDTRLIKNKDLDTKSLSFRNLAHIALITEDQIIKQESPFVSGLYDKTFDYSVFRMLLTGEDDANYRATVEAAKKELNEKRSAREAALNKINLVDELLAEAKQEIKELEITADQAEFVVSRLPRLLSERHERYFHSQAELQQKWTVKHQNVSGLQEVGSRLSEIDGLLARFALLHNHYHVDLERLSFIKESGSTFIYLDHVNCPFCGASPELHNGTDCIEDIPEIVLSAESESKKILRLISDLDVVMLELAAEKDELLLKKSTLETTIEKLNADIQQLYQPAKTLQSSIEELAQYLRKAQKAQDLFKRVNAYESKKIIFDLQANTDVKTNFSKLEIPADVLQEYCGKVKDILLAWNFPQINEVGFDYKTNDLVINGQLRSTRGKGIRAITHSAMSIAMLEICREKNIPHPGFVVLDSPLQAYYKPDDPSDSLEGCDLKERFYTYLASNNKDCQVIVFDNELPVVEEDVELVLHKFTKNLAHGRYGFFPGSTIDLSLKALTSESGNYISEFRALSPDEQLEELEELIYPGYFELIYSDVVSVLIADTYYFDWECDYFDIENYEITEDEIVAIITWQASTCQIEDEDVSLPIIVGTANVVIDSHGSVSFEKVKATFEDN